MINDNKEKQSDSNTSPSSGKQVEQQVKKEDKVAIAKEKMNESKNKWMKKPINFLTRNIQNKYAGCVTKRIGVKHINEGIPCQDNYHIFPDASNIKKEFIIVAVSDGHGDKKHDQSEFGSKIACEQLCNFVKETLEDKKFSGVDFFTSVKFKTMLVDRWKANVLEHHKNKFSEDSALETDAEKILLRYGTTLLFAFIFNGFYVVGQLGDGGIIILNNDDAKCRMHKPMPNAKIGGGTASLCMEYADAFMNIKVYPEEDCSGIVLMTDGYYDLWSSNESRFKASKFFIDTLISNESDIDKAELAYKEKYNEAVDFAVDDVTNGLLIPLKTKDKTNDNKKQYAVSNIHSSCNRTTYTLSAGTNKYKLLFLNNFKLRKIKSENNPLLLSGITFPINVDDEKGLQYYVYNGLSDKRQTLDDYCESFIINKKYSMDIIISIKVLINILNTIKNNWTLFEKKIISLSELSDIIEFSIDDVSVMIYWTYPEKRISKGNINEIISKYIINFLSCGKLFYDDEVVYDFNLENSLYIKNLKKYPKSYTDLLLDATSPKSGITINNLLEETISLQRYYVYCSNCGKISLCDKESLACTCEKTFTIFAFLHGSSNKDNIIPLSVNTVIHVYDQSTAKYERVIEILGNNKNEIGLKNISNKTWKAKTKNDETKDVEPGKIKDFSDCISLLIHNEKYEIIVVDKNEGKQYGKIN